MNHDTSSTISFRRSMLVQRILYVMASEALTPNCILQPFLFRELRAWQFFFYVISHWLRAANKVFPSNGKDGFQLTCIQTYKLTEQDCCYRHQLTCLGGWEREHTIDWERWWKYVVEFSSISCYWSCKQGLETYIGSCWHSADKSTFSCRVIDAEYI